MEKSAHNRTARRPAFDNGLSARNRLRRMWESVRRTVGLLFGRIKLFEIALSVIGIWAAYLLGMHVTGRIHASSRWMGAMLACTSVVVVLQKGSYRDSLMAGVTRVLGTLIGAVTGYIYLRMWHFSVGGMLCAVAVLEALLMLLRMYANGQMAVITMLIILLVSKMSPEVNPEVNALLRFFESAVGSGVGIALLWCIERYRKNSKISK